MNFIEKKNLANLVSEFQKLSSELKVPDSILNECITWAKSCFCKNVLDRHNIRIKAMRARKFDLDEINEISESTKFRALLFVFTANDDPNDTAEQILNLLQHSNFIIPNFSHNEDQKSGLDGTFSVINKSPALDIAFGSPASGRYSCSILIDHGKIQVSIKKTNVSKQEILSIIKSYIEDIYYIMKDFEKLTSRFDTFQFLDKEYKQQLGFVRGECIKNINDRMLANPYKLVIDLTKSKYFFKHEIEANKQFEIQIWCHFISSPDAAKKINSESSWRGLWTGQLYVYEKEDDEVFDNIQLLRAIMKDIEATVRHELQHMMQWLIGDIKNKEDKVGLPGKKLMSPTHDLYGIPNERGGDSKINDRQQHELRDVEFYTRIADSIHDYKNIVGRIPLGARSSFFKVWTSQIEFDVFDSVMQREFRKLYGLERDWHGISNFDKATIEDSRQFFDALKNAQPLKYRKAVAEVYKAVSVAGLV